METAHTYRSLSQDTIFGANKHGRVAGAGINTHVHFHIVPRWNGDTNFMPVFSETRIISEQMDEVYRKLVAARDELLNNTIK